MSMLAASNLRYKKHAIVNTLFLLDSVGRLPRCCFKIIWVLLPLISGQTSMPDTVDSVVTASSDVFENEELVQQD